MPGTIPGGYPEYPDQLVPGSARMFCTGVVDLAPYPGVSAAQPGALQRLPFGAGPCVACEARWLCGRPRTMSSTRRTSWRASVNLWRTGVGIGIGVGVGAPQQLTLTHTHRDRDRMRALQHQAPRHPGCGFQVRGYDCSACVQYCQRHLALRLTVLRAHPLSMPSTLIKSFLQATPNRLINGRVWMMTHGRRNQPNAMPHKSSSSSDTRGR